MPLPERNELSHAGPDAWPEFPQGIFPAPMDSAWQWTEGENGWLIGRSGAASPPANFPPSLESLRKPEDLAPGVVLWKAARQELRAAAPVSFGFDVHWLKEVAEGVLRGTTGVRLHNAGRVLLQARAGGQWQTAAWREDVDGVPGLRMAVWQAEGRAASLAGWLHLSASADPASSAAVRDLVGALAGIHPLQWVRGLLNSVGSRRAEEFVQAAGATLRALDAVRELWMATGGQAEAVLWNILGEPARWRRFLERLSSAVQEDLVSALPDPAAPAAASRDGAAQDFAEWALAVVRSAGAVPGPVEAAAAVKEAAQRILRTLELEGAEAILLALAPAAARELDRAAPGRWARQQLEELFGSGADLAQAVLGGAWDGLAGRIASAAAEAVRRQWELRLAAALHSQRSRTAAADVTFRFDERGLASARRAAAGDLDAVLSGDGVLQLRRAALTDVFSQRFFVEVQLPFLRLRRKQKDLASVASAQAVVTEDGRIQLDYSAEAADAISSDLRNQTAMVLSAALSVRDGEVIRDHFTLSFTDRRVVPPGGFRTAYRRVLELYGLTEVPEPDGPCTAQLALRLPGTLAEAWMRSPLPGTAGYMPAMGRAARAIQCMAREWLPALYLDSLDAYSRPSAVHPLLAWACSPPSSGPRKKDLSYDFMDPKVIDAVLEACAPAFRERLALIHQMLLEAGRKQAAAYYEPADTRYILANVRRQQRNFAALLAADAFLVESVLHVAECARELDRLARTSPKAAVGELGRFTREVAETFHRRLRRLYAGADFLALGPLFFLAATSALADEWGETARIGAVLTLELEDGRRMVFSNDAARRLF